MAVDVGADPAGRAPRGAADPADPAGPSRGRPGVLRLPLAVIGGLLLVAAFPTHDVWPAAPAGVAAIVLAVRGARPGRAALLGLSAGLAFFVPLLSWSGIYVGPAPWLLLALSQAAFFALLGAALALVTRLPGWPVWAAAGWVAVEALRGRVPYDGFGWGRLAFGLADSPYLALAPLGGAALMSFAAALTGALAAALLAAVLGGARHRRASGTDRPRRARATVTLGLLVAASVALPLAVPLVRPLPPQALPEAAPTATVALVQGNVPRLGLDFNAQRREVLGNHVRRTRELAARVRAGELARPDLVVWPENSSDIDPFVDPEAYALIEGAVRDVGVPVLVGAVLNGPGRFISNVGILWDPVTGPGQRYVKRQPVPFAEYIPLRPVARLFSAEVDRRPRDFTAGDEVGSFAVSTPRGTLRLGDLICFEVSDDDLVHDVAAAGADVLAVQTNNATFGFTPESEQQLAMSRVRAAEHGREVLVAATSGVSAVVGPDGGVRQRVELFTPGVLVAAVPIGGPEARARPETLATRLAPGLEVGLATLGGFAVTAALLRGRAGAHRLGRPEDQEGAARP